MNRIDYIEIQYIKGKDNLKLEFDDFCANKPNILVAPNGFGKSTVTKAFLSIKPSKLELKRDDIYKNDISKKPCLKVKFAGNPSGEYIANDIKNDFYNTFDIKVINNAVVAKSHYSTAGAELKIEPIEIYSSIPSKKEVGYSFSTIKEHIKCQGKILNNLSDVLNNVNNLVMLKDCKEDLLRSNINKRAKSKIDHFLSTIPSEGTANQIKEKISHISVETLLSESCIEKVYNIVSEFSNNELNTEINNVLNTIQIITWYGINYQSDNSFLDKIIKYIKYIENRRVLDERLKLFNTTGRDIKTEKDGNKVVVKFENSNNMSNGERDVLVFLTELFKFEITMKKNNAILIIDEIFDYLDGSNLLIAQYYLSCLIGSCKESQRTIFLLIFTHLDPNLFNNYYFSDKKIHYLIDIPNNCLHSNIVKIIQNRDTNDTNDFTSKYLLHYHYDDKTIPREVLDNTDGNFPISSKQFQDKSFDEVQNYLCNRSYNPVLVIVGIRIKVEKIAYSFISSDKIEDFINTHTTINKLLFAKEFAELPEELFLLQPLYNDVLHLNNNVNQTKNKLKACSLKLYNNSIKNIIKILFS